MNTGLFSTSKAALHSAFCIVLEMHCYSSAADTHRSARHAVRHPHPVSTVILQSVPMMHCGGLCDVLLGSWLQCRVLPYPQVDLRHR